MLTNIYVVDYIVRDIEAAKATFDPIFGTEPLWFNPAMAPGRTLNAMYYQMPGNGAGAHAIGIFDHSGDAPEAEHDGVILLGILCDNIEATVAEIEGRGLKFLYDKPQRYAVGRNNILGPLNGVSFSIAQHDEGGYAKAQSMMVTRGGSHDFGDPSQAACLNGSTWWISPFAISTRRSQTIEPCLAWIRSRRRTSVLIRMYARCTSRRRAKVAGSIRWDCSNSSRIRLSPKAASG